MGVPPSQGSSHRGHKVPQIKNNTFKKLYYLEGMAAKHCLL